MKNKIVLMVIFTLIFNTTFIYGDDKIENINVSDVVKSYEHIFGENVEYNEKTDTYHFVIENGKERSALAVSGGALSAILALAVKSGLEFATSNSMGEFLNKLFMVDGIKGVVSEIEGVVSNSVDGVLNFSRSLLDTVKSKYAEAMTNNSGSVYYRGQKVLSFTSDPTKSDMRYVFDNFKPILSHDRQEIYDSDGVNRLRTKTDFKFLSPEGFLEFETFGTSSKFLYTYIYDSSFPSEVQEYYNVSVSGWDNNYYWYPCIRYVKGLPYLDLIINFTDSITGLYSTSYYVPVRIKLPVEYLGGSSVLPTIGNAWSDSIPGNGDDTSSSLDIKVPSNTNSLVGQLPNNVTDKPSYETWTPGITVTIPTIDTGSDDVVDVPNYEVINPPSTEDTPGDDTETPSLSWDWLKNLFNKLLEMIQNIIDWLTNFWDNLLEFIKSIFVPSDSYFTDKFGDIMDKLEDKMPTLDINKLEQLAVGESRFEDVYATFFGMRCLVVRGSVINQVVGWARPIIQGLLTLLLLLYNYNQIHFLIRGKSIVRGGNSE